MSFPRGKILNNNIVIWGAGKIGRGFIGDLFYRAGYQITFIDADKKLTETLGAQGFYTVYNLRSEADQEKKLIDRFSILHFEERIKVQAALTLHSSWQLLFFLPLLKIRQKGLLNTLRKDVLERTPRPWISSSVPIFIIRNPDSENSSTHFSVKKGKNTSGRMSGLQSP
ncbi:MAG: hypothetical protein DRP49_00915 [Spirochaetes bacterium]|nr:MAG: hypothetical protein DRP49_00915 [Spirochaetota bacterium]